MSIAQPRPRFFAFVGSSGLEIGVLGDLLASCFDVNLAVVGGGGVGGRGSGRALGGGAARLPGTGGRVHERRHRLEHDRAGGCTRAGAAGDAPRAACGNARRDAVLLGGGSLLGAARRRGARHRRGRRCGGSRSTRSAASTRRRSAARSTPTILAGVVPVAVVATAGTTLTGAVDPIDAIADVCEPRGVWLHVDGAYGLPAAATPSAGHLFAGLDRADSVTLDAHKWLYLPKACGVAARAPARRSLHGARPRGGLHPARAARVAHGRHHARVLAAVPRAQALARVPCARGRRLPGSGGAEPRAGTAPARARLASATELEPLCGAAAALDRARSATSRRTVTSTSTTRDSSARCRRTAACGWLPPRSTARCACGRASSTSARSDDDVRALVDLTCELGGRA